MIPKGEPTVESAVKSFLTAIEAQNRAKLVALVHPDFTADQELAQYLQQYGGGKFESLTIEVTPNTVSSALATARVRGQFVAAQQPPKPFALELSAQKQGAGWFLTLGRPAKAPSERSEPTQTKP